MKCKFKFTVRGRIRLDRTVPIPTRQGVYSFGLDAEGKLETLDVTVTLPRGQWPIVTKDPSPGVRAHINTNLVQLPFIQQDLKSLQGLLVFFGMDSLDYRNPEVEWIPESEAERAELPIFSFKVTEEPFDDKDPLSFDLIARAILASHDAYDSQVPLNFFRRAMRDMAEQSFVDAIYDFYFVLETLYAGGQFRSRQVKEVFKANAEFMSCVKKALAEPPPPAALGRRLGEEYRHRFGAMSPENLIDHLVDVRGRLHHHSLKDRRQPWHPEEQHQYQVDAVMLQSIAMHVMWLSVERYLYEPSIVSAYEALVRGQKQS